MTEDQTPASPADLHQLWEEAINDSRPCVAVNPVIDRLKRRYQVMREDQKIAALQQALIDGENSGPGEPLNMAEIIREAKREKQ